MLPASYRFPRRFWILQANPCLFLQCLPSILARLEVDTPSESRYKRGPLWIECAAGILFLLLWPTESLRSGFVRGSPAIFQASNRSLGQAQPVFIAIPRAVLCSSLARGTHRIWILVWGTRAQVSLSGIGSGIICRSCPEMRCETPLRKICLFLQVREKWLRSAGRGAFEVAW